MENIKNDLGNLRKLLPHGAISEIAKQSNTTIYTVSRVFNGRSKNIKVIRAIGDYVKGIMDKNTEIRTFIDYVKKS